MPEMVEAPRAATRRSQIEEDKAIEDGEFAMVIHGVKAHFGMDHKVGDGHLAGENQEPCGKTAGYVKAV